MNYIIKHSWKIQAAFWAVLFLSLTGCGSEQGFTTTGSNSPITVIDSGEDTKAVDVDSSSAVDNSVENAPVEPTE